MGMRKIKCDDCKFESECADYGWPGCKKFTPAPSELQTNEEYIRTCSTEEMEHTLTMLEMQDMVFGDKELAYVTTRLKIHRWLKEKHKNG